MSQPASNSQLPVDDVSAARPSRAAIRAETRAELRLAVPLALGHLGNQLMGMVDMVMLGHYSRDALAGAGIANSLYFAITVLGMGLVMGLDTLVPQALGAGKLERARALLGRGVRLGFLVSLPLSVAVALVPLALPVIGVDEAIARQAWLYALWRVPGVVPFLVGTALRSYLQARSVTRPMIIAVVIGNLVNLVADAVLVFGDAALVRVGLPAIGLPAMGVTGAALASSLVLLASTAVFALAVRAMHRDQPQPSSREAGLMTAIARLGLPVGLQLGAEVGIFSLVGMLAGRLGVVPAAAHQVALVLSSLTFSMALGISAATSVRVGLGVGAGDTPGARLAGLVGIGLGTAAMSIPAALFVLVPAPLARIFTSDPEVIQAVVPLLHIAAVFQLFDGVQVVSAGALRGAGDSRATLVANLIGHYLVGVSVAVGLAFGAGIGAPGLWWGLSAGLIVVAIIQVARFLHVTSRPIVPHL